MEDTNCLINKLLIISDSYYPIIYCQFIAINYALNIIMNLSSSSLIINN